MPMLMQNAIAKMIQKPCEANAGREICISVFEPRSLPALAHYHPRSDSPERLGGLLSFGPLISDLLTCGLLPLLRAPCSPFYLIKASAARVLVQKLRTYLPRQISMKKYEEIILCNTFYCVVPRGGASGPRACPA